MGEPEHRAWGAQKYRVQLLILGGEGPQSVCPCVRPVDALRARCTRVCVARSPRGQRPHQSGFGVALLTGGMAHTPRPATRPKGQEPGASCWRVPWGMQRGLQPQRLWATVCFQGPRRSQTTPGLLSALQPASVPLLSMPSTLHPDQRLGAGLLRPAEWGALTHLDLVPALSPSQHDPVQAHLPQSR